MTKSNRHPSRRNGSVYLAVLGTALIASMLALSALGLQRIQNRRLTSSRELRQAQLNAEAAIELGLLTIKQNSNWRTTYANASVPWFTRSTGAGTSSLTVTDPLDGNLTNDPNAPFMMLGIGISGNSQQRVERCVDPRPQPANVLSAAASAGGAIPGQNANIDWNTVVSLYQSAGTSINYNSLPTADQFELGRNVGINTNFDDWMGTLPGLSKSASLTGPVSFSGRSACLRVDRSDKEAGTGNRLQSRRLKPNTTYQVTVEVHPNLSVLVTSNRFKVFMITEYANGNTVPSPGNTTLIQLANNVWTTLSTSITTPAWTEEPANVYLVVNSDHSSPSPSGNSNRFYVDNLHVYENTTGRFLYQQALGPIASNPNGIYWINCGGSKLVIERSRIFGTLVLLNPGTGSCIANGPIHLSPAKPGYPSLVVQGNFAIRATSRALSEAECGTNFNSSGLPFEAVSSQDPPTDAAPSGINDVYPSEIQGLVAVSGNLTYENQPRMRGQVIVGGAISGTSSFEHRLDALYSPPPGFTGSTAYDRRPASVRKVVE